MRIPTILQISIRKLFFKTLFKCKHEIQTGLNYERTGGQKSLDISPLILTRRGLVIEGWGLQVGTRLPRAQWHLCFKASGCQEKRLRNALATFVKDTLLPLSTCALFANFRSYIKWGKILNGWCQLFKNAKQFVM